jgi:hypothetical protein
LIGMLMFHIDRLAMDEATKGQHQEK